LFSVRGAVGSIPTRRCPLPALFETSVDATVSDGVVSDDAELLTSTEYVVTGEEANRLDITKSDWQPPNSVSLLSATLPDTLEMSASTDVAEYERMLEVE